MSNPATSFKAFLGEREETFCITPALIPELEQISGAGIGSVFKRLVEGHYRHGDIIHTIRLGLVGGGMSPQQAAHICEVYVAPRPVLETYSIALSIIERLWYGAPIVEALIAEIKKAEHAAV